MNAAILSQIASASVPVETLDNSINQPVSVENIITPTIKKTFSDYFTDETIKFLTVMNTIYIIGRIFEWWS